MGTGCWLRTTIHYRGESFKTKDDVQDKIDQNNRIIEMCERDLLMYMTMTEPAKFWRESESEVGETPLTWMYNEVQRCIDGIKECTEENSRLYILLYEWDECHTEWGVAIEQPKGETRGSYYGGDFIDSVYPDGSQAHNVRESIFGMVESVPIPQRHG